MVDLMKSFSYTPDANFSEVIFLHSSVLVLVGRYSSLLHPDTCFSDEFLLHSTW